MAEMILLAILAFFLGQFLPRNWPKALAEWRDRVEGGPASPTGMEVDALIQAIFSHPARHEILARIADEARKKAEELRARAEEQRKH